MRPSQLARRKAAHRAFSQRVKTAHTERFAVNRIRLTVTAITTVVSYELDERFHIERLMQTADQARRCQKFESLHGSWRKMCQTRRRRPRGSRRCCPTCRDYADSCVAVSERDAPPDPASVDPVRRLDP